MKKVLQFVIILLFLSLIYQLIILLFVKEYHYNYEYVENKKTYKISENYQKVGKDNLYNINISDKKGNNYSFILNHNYHKEQEIVADLTIYHEGDLTCLFPTFRDKVYTNFMCNVNGNSVSYNYLKQQNDKRVDTFVKQLKAKGYNLEAWKSNISFKEINGNNTKLTYYTNFLDQYNVVVWKYNGVYSISKKKQAINEFLNFDVYDTKHLALTKDKMYVMNIEEGNSSFDKIYMVNFKDGKMRFLDIIDDNVSSNSYFNGVYNNNVYFLDCNSNTQYKINENNEKMEKTSKNNIIKYFDGKKLINKEVDNLKNSNIKFYNKVINKSITDKYKTRDIRESNGNYYFRTDDGNMYMANNKGKKVVLLFNFKEFKEWVVADDTIFGINKDTLYAYNFNFGLKPLIKYNEFNYHTDNMYGVVKE